MHCKECFTFREINVSPFRISYDGLYSIRTTTPVDNGGHSIEFYPAEFEKGTLYEISAWVYSAKPGMTVMFHALNSFKPLGKVYEYWYRV